MNAANAIIEVEGLAKTYILHTQGGTRLPVFKDAAFRAGRGECVALHGPSGSGKSTQLRCLYGNCRPDEGRILVRHDGTEIDIASASPRAIMDVRRTTIGYVSQFLRVIPRVPALDIVAQPLKARGVSPEEAQIRAAEMLAVVRIPERLWHLAPATFSGGEQQRVNIARGFAAETPILLLDEPTASLDSCNRAIVVALIHQAKDNGTTVIGVFHDDEIRNAVADRVLPLAGVAA